MSMASALRLLLAAALGLAMAPVAHAQVGLGNDLQPLEIIPLDEPPGEPYVGDQPLGDGSQPLGDPFDGLLAPEGESLPDIDAAGQEITYAEAPVARLRGLDTLTSTVNDFEIRVGETVAFKRLIVTLEACRYPEGDIAGDAYAYLRIRDERDEEPRFTGWMIASSPALSALDHPRYDVWVLNCSTD